MQIGPGDAGTHGLLDQIAKRDVHALPVYIAHVELNLFDRRDGPGNSVIRLFHRRHIGNEHASRLNVAEHELPVQRRYSTVIGETIGHRSAPVSYTHLEPTRLLSISYAV